MKWQSSKAFSLAELLVVIGIISLILSIVLIPVSTARATARDKQRIADLHRIYLALLQYADDNGGLSVGSLDYNGWDISSQPSGAPTFLSFLQTNKYLPSNVFDPLNNGSNNVLSGGQGYAYGYKCDTIDNTFSLGAKMEINKDYKVDYDQQFPKAYWDASNKIYWITYKEPIKRCS